MGNYRQSVKMSKKAQSKVVNTSGWDPRPWTRPGLGEEQVMEIKDAFDLFDKDRSGEITVGEMLEAMRSLGYDVDGGEAASTLSSTVSHESDGVVEVISLVGTLPGCGLENTTSVVLEEVSVDGQGKGTFLGKGRGDLL